MVEPVLETSCKYIQWATVSQRVCYDVLAPITMNKCISLMYRGGSITVCSERYHLKYKDLTQFPVAT